MVSSFLLGMFLFCPSERVHPGGLQEPPAGKLEQIKTTKKSEKRKGNNYELEI
jgi:hypothetical protein